MPGKDKWTEKKVLAHNFNQLQFVHFVMRLIESCAFISANYVTQYLSIPFNHQKFSRIILMHKHHLQINIIFKWWSRKFIFIFHTRIISFSRRTSNKCLFTVATASSGANPSLFCFHMIYSFLTLYKWHCWLFSDCSSHQVCKMLKFLLHLKNLLLLLAV